MKAMPTIPRPTTKILVRVWGGGGFERVVWVVAVVEDESEGEDGRDEVDPEAEAEDEDAVGGIGAVMMGRISEVVKIGCRLWSSSRREG
jgi:hypothetical protein